MPPPASDEAKRAMSPPTPGLLLAAFLCGGCLRAMVSKNTGRPPRHLQTVQSGANSEVASGNHKFCMLTVFKLGDSIAVRPADLLIGMAVAPCVVALSAVGGLSLMSVSNACHTLAEFAKFAKPIAAGRSL